MDAVVLSFGYVFDSGRNASVYSVALHTPGTNISTVLLTLCVSRQILDRYWSNNFVTMGPLKVESRRANDGVGEGFYVRQSFWNFLTSSQISEHLGLFRGDDDFRSVGNINPETPGCSRHWSFHFLCSLLLSDSTSQFGFDLEVAAMWAEHVAHWHVGLTLSHFWGMCVIFFEGIFRFCLCLHADCQASQ